MADSIRKSRIVILVAVLAVSADAGPDRLRELVGQSDFKTAEFDWTMSHLAGANTGLVERYKTQIADDSVLQSNFGDEHGFHEVQFRSGPRNSEMTLEELELKGHIFPRENSAGTRNTLRHEGRIWDLPQVERPVFASTGPAGHSMLRNPVDFSLIGLSPAWVSFSENPLHISPLHYQGFETARFEPGFQSGLRTVTATYSDEQMGEKRLTWYFDDRRGGQPVRAMLEFNREVYYSETELQQIDGRWLPASVRYYKNDSTVPDRILEVQKATFDEEWHKQEITPEDLGAEFGTQATVTDELDWSFWDGNGLTPRDDFWESVYGFGVMFGERVLKARAKTLDMSEEEFRNFYTESQHAEKAREHYRQKHVVAHGEEPIWVTIKKSKEKDPWDVYVEEFLAKHELPKPGVERAKKLLEEAKKLRDANRHRVRKAEREGDRKTIERYKEREERIYRERLVDPLDQLAATIAKENRDRQDKAPD